MDANTLHGIDPYKTYVSMCTPLYFKTPNNITFKRDAKSVVSMYLKYGQLPYETKATITGYNDIETLHPEIKELWDFDLLASNIYNCLLYNMYSTEQKNDLETTPIIV